MAEKNVVVAESRIKDSEIKKLATNLEKAEKKLSEQSKAVSKFEEVQSQYAAKLAEGVQLMNQNDGYRAVINEQKSEIDIKKSQLESAAIIALKAEVLQAALEKQLQTTEGLAVSTASALAAAQTSQGD